MDIYVINLDRHPQRLAHMTTQLRGLAFHRITAIDGRDLSGPEHRIPGRHRAGQLLTRYERACIASHRITLDAFLQSGARHACILEDDILISPDFSTFMTDGDWMQAAWDVVKIETTMKKISWAPMLLRAETGIWCRSIPFMLVARAMSLAARGQKN